MAELQKPAGPSYYPDKNFQDIQIEAFTARVKGSKLVTKADYTLKNVEITLIVPDFEIGGLPDGSKTISGAIEYATKHGRAFVVNMSSIAAPQQNTEGNEDD